jgi:hypothetical protein
MIDHYGRLSPEERAQIRTYGVLESQLADVVAHTAATAGREPVEMVGNILSYISRQVGDLSSDSEAVLDIQQALNRASWIISNYVKECSSV